MKTGDLVRITGDDVIQQVWCVKDVKSDHRGIWIRIDEEEDVWRDSRVFEVIDGDR